MFFKYFFTKKETKEKILGKYPLQEIPLFYSFSEFELKSLSKNLTITEKQKNELIYKEGDAVRNFYVILSGKCKAYTDKNGLERILGYLYKGDYFGEVSILTGKKHAANVSAISDITLLVIPKETFLELMRKSPDFSIQISRQLGFRVKKLYEPENYEEGSKIIALFQFADPLYNSLFTENFAASLNKETGKRVLVIKSSTGNERQRGEILKALKSSVKNIEKIHVPSSLISEMDSSETIEFVTQILKNYRFIVIIADKDTENSEMFKLADIFYFISFPKKKNLQEMRNKLAYIRKSGGYTNKEVKVILYHPISQEKLSLVEKEKILNWKIFSLIPYPDKDFHNDTDKLELIKDPNSPFSRTIKYLAKSSAGILTGIALGSGAAFGLAHIGVLKAIEEKGIEIDIVAGCSIGSIIGALWAAGYNASEIEKITLQFKKRRNLLKLANPMDIVFPLYGITSGNSIKKFLSKYIKNKDFKHMKKPLRIVATNLETAENAVFREGKVINAIRASISIPGIMSPVKHEGKLLIDGGVTNPLPISLLLDEGVKNIIAVNVFPSSSELKKIKTENLNNNNKKNSLFNRIIKSLFRGNSINVLMNTIQYLETVLALKEAENADIFIHAALPNGNWAEFYNPEKFIDYGRKKAMEVLDGKPSRFL